MTLPPSDFADAFRTHSVPKLKRMIGVSGWFVGVGWQSFDEADSAVLSYAIRLGASRLPPEHFDALHDWIAATIAEVAADAEARCGQ